MPRFYADQLGAQLRRGDIVEGFPVTTPSLDAESASGRVADWKIIAQQPKHLVVLSPCCSIEEKNVLMAPLTRITEKQILETPRLLEDPTRVNREMTLAESLSPDHYQRIPPATRNAREAKGPVYACAQVFCYSPHRILGSYLSGDRTIEHWQVKFTDIYKLQWKHIARGQAIPAGVKVLELSIEARNDLRLKLSKFFFRPAEEDGQIPL